MPARAVVTISSAASSRAATRARPIAARRCWSGSSLSKPHAAHPRPSMSTTTIGRLSSSAPGAVTPIVRRGLAVSASRRASESAFFGPRSPLWDRQHAAHAVRQKLLERVSRSTEAQAALVDLLGALQRRGGNSAKLFGRGSPGQPHSISFEAVLGQLETLKGDPDFQVAVKRLMTALSDTSVGDTLSLLLKNPKEPPKA